MIYLSVFLRFSLYKYISRVFNTCSVVLQGILNFFSRHHGYYSLFLFMSFSVVPFPA